MEEVKIEKKQKQMKKPQENVMEESDDPFAALDHSTTMELSLPTTILQPKPTKKETRTRSQTVTSPNESPGSRKSLRRGKSDYEKRRSSTFYLSPNATDVTTPFVHPMMEMEVLRVSNRSQAELLDLMASVGNLLCSFTSRFVHLVCSTFSVLHTQYMYILCSYVHVLYSCIITYMYM